MLSKRRGYRLTWIPADKARGFGGAQVTLGNLSHADAFFIVTGRISHTVMHGARHASRRLGARCRFLESLSERQIQEALNSLERDTTTFHH